jgi:hypothetical protein
MVAFEGVTKVDDRDTNSSVADSQDSLCAVVVGLMDDSDDDRAAGVVFDRAVEEIVDNAPEAMRVSGSDQVGLRRFVGDLMSWAAGLGFGDRGSDLGEQVGRLSLQLKKLPAVESNDVLQLVSLAIHPLTGSFDVCKRGVEHIRQVGLSTLVVGGHRR